MPITLHERTGFLITDDSGDFVEGGERGLYREDTRFLSRYQLLIDGLPLVLLGAKAARSNEATHVLANHESARLAQASLGAIRHRVLDVGLREDLDVQSYVNAELSFTLDLQLGADFADIFEVKASIEGLGPAPAPATLMVPSPEQLVLLAGVEPGPEETPRTVVGFSDSPDEVVPPAARWHVRLPPRGAFHLCVHILPVTWADPPRPPDSGCDMERIVSARRQREARLSALGGGPVLETDHPVLARAYRQAVQDLVALRIKNEETSPEGAVAAGIPWFMALFGRDSLIASYQALLHFPGLAQGTLRALARLQGRRVDPDSDEEPGKILHEHRQFLLVSARRAFRFPYYGSVDATPLFIITLSEYARVTGDLGLVRELWDNVRRALAWMADYGDRDGDGLIEYDWRPGEWLRNKGWKDSPESVRFGDGRIAQPPIALVEVQGYAFDALGRAAELAERLDDTPLAVELRTRALLVREQLERFWLADRAYYAQALDGTKQRADAITSNPGHLLWSGAVSPERARALAAGLLAPGMFSGYGVRTMSSGEPAYNPASYHDGSVWPHDTSLILAGLVRYGLVDEAARVAEAMLAAAAELEDRSLPELFAGYDADRCGMLVRYPTANRPQAWAAGAVVLLVRALLGIEVNAFERRMTVNPIALPGLGYLRLRGLPVGGARIDIEVAVRNRKAIAAVRGLPAGWKRR